MYAIRSYYDYKQSKPYLDNSEVNLLIEDNFQYDEDLDDERDIRKKKLAYKEEVAVITSYSIHYTKLYDLRIISIKSYIVFNCSTSFFHKRN